MAPTERISAAIPVAGGSPSNPSQAPGFRFHRTADDRWATPGTYRHVRVPRGSSRPERE